MAGGWRRRATILTLNDQIKLLLKDTADCNSCSSGTAGLKPSLTSRDNDREGVWFNGHSERLNGSLTESSCSQITQFDGPNGFIHLLIIKYSISLFDNLCDSIMENDLGFKPRLSFCWWNEFSDERCDRTFFHSNGKTETVAYFATNLLCCT